MDKAENEQGDIDQSLNHIEQQQRDLSTALEVYEKQAEDILGKQGGTLRSLDTGPADSERDKKSALCFLFSSSSAPYSFVLSLASCSLRSSIPI